MTMIPQTCWDKMLGYLGMEQNLMKIKKRDWRFEETRADLNRVRYLIRATFYAVNRGDAGLTRRVHYWFYNVVTRKRMDKHLRHRLVMAELVSRHTPMKDCETNIRKYRQFYNVYKNVKSAVKMLHPAFPDPRLPLALLL